MRCCVRTTPRTQEVLGGRQLTRPEILTLIWRAAGVGKPEVLCKTEILCKPEILCKTVRVSQGTRPANSHRNLKGAFGCQGPLKQL